MRQHFSNVISTISLMEVPQGHSSVSCLFLLLHLCVTFYPNGMIPLPNYLFTVSVVHAEALRSI